MEHLPEKDVAVVRSIAAELNKSKFKESEHRLSVLTEKLQDKTFNVQIQVVNKD